ncbi:MAG: hypothetical protein ACLUHE_05445 [Christensenellales bacterium]
MIRLIFGMDGTPVLRRLSAAVQASRFLWEHWHPLVPGRLHLTIPALATSSPPANSFPPNELDFALLSTKLLLLCQ